MIRWAEVPVYLHRQPVDFRKSINGLAQVVEQAMGRSPMERALFVFGPRSRNKVKVLYWDLTGFCLWTKRLEKDRFAWPRSTDEAVLHLSVEQLDWLLRGFDILRMKPHAARNFEMV
jgi:transposase